MLVRFLVALFLITQVSVPALSHQGTTDDAIRYKASLFILALLNSSGEEAKHLLADSFESGSSEYTGSIILNKSQFLNQIVETAVELSEATIVYGATSFISEEEANFGPIVLYIDNGEFAALAMTLNFTRIDEEWLISGVSYSTALPEGANDHFKDMKMVWSEVSFTIKNEEGPVASRINLIDQSGKYWPPLGKPSIVRTGHNEKVGGSVSLNGQLFAYVPSTFITLLPDGDYTVTIEHGPEHETLVETFTVAGAEKSIELEVNRLYNARAEGWYSADTHVHFLDPSTALLEAAAEDLDFVNLLATKWGWLHTGVEHFTGSPMRSPTSGATVYVNQEARHGQFGHLSLLNLKKLIYPLSWGGPGEGVPEGVDFPSVKHHAESAKAQGGFTGWAHLPLHTGELPILLTENLLDGAELMVWGDPIFDLYQGKISATQLYYTILNAGFTIPAIAGTDKMTNLQTVGSVRTYAFTNGDPSYLAWINAARDGRTFVSTGPLLTFSLKDAQLGDHLELGSKNKLSGSINIRSKHPVERVELVCNGDVIWSKSNLDEANNLGYNFSIAAPPQGGWIAARAYSRTRLPIQMWPPLTPQGSPIFAHSSPIYLIRDGALPSKKEAVRKLIEMNDANRKWLEERGSFQSEEQKYEMLRINKTAADQLERRLSSAH
ncbi:MAG: hypothetical protein Hens3KO_18370 [Henriciella sp.]